MADDSDEDDSHEDDSHEDDSDAPDSSDSNAKNRKYKKGGKVHGKAPKQRLDKRARGGSGIHIKPSHKGLFTKKAKAAGKGVQEYAQEEKDAGGTLGKEANFALNAKKFKH